MKNRTNWLLVAYGITIIAVQTAYLFRILPANASPDTKNEAVEASNCVEVEKGHWDCSEPATRVKWMEYQDSVIDKQEEEIGRLKNDPRIILRIVCRENGYTDAECPAILYGMAMVESRMNGNMIGDSGKSLGYYQIHRGYHPGVSDMCKRDLSCSADWTLKRMIRMGFSENRDNAIRAHNGSLNNPVTAEYLAKVKEFAKQF